MSTFPSTFNPAPSCLPPEVVDWVRKRHGAQIPFTILLPYREDVASGDDAYPMHIFVTGNVQCLAIKQHKVIYLRPQDETHSNVLLAAEHGSQSPGEVFRHNGEIYEKYIMFVCEEEGISVVWTADDFSDENLPESRLVVTVFSQTVLANIMRWLNREWTF